MQVLVAGGTGVLGRQAVPQLSKAGHDVVVVTRDAGAAEWARHVGAIPTALDLFDADAVARRAEGVDAIINLATAIPPTPWPASRWLPNDRLRRDASAAMAAAAVRTGARYVQESFAPTYADGADAWITEDHPLAPADQVRSVVDAEASAAAVTAAGGTGVVLRFGLFYDAASRQTRQMLDMARRGVLPLPGPGSAHTSMVHVADAATAVVASLHLPAGTYNVVEDQPLPRGAHAAVLAGLLGRGRVRLLPAIVGRVPILRVLARSQRISNARLRAASGWAPAYPTVREGWAQVIEAVDRGW